MAGCSGAAFQAMPSVAMVATLLQCINMPCENLFLIFDVNGMLTAPLFTAVVRWE